MALSRPSTKSVQAVVARYDLDSKNSLVDRALQILFDTYPLNTDPAHVLLKVTTLNQLYSTQIFDVVTVAQHITSCSIDDRVRTGDPDLVELIATARFNGKPRTNYSFATKYCSWHNREKFPIYDTLAAKQIRAYQREYIFATFTYQTLKDYRQFVEVLRKFRSEFNLSDVSIRDIDKFLWYEGKHGSSTT